MAIERPNTRERHYKLTLPNAGAEVWLEPAGSQVIMHMIGGGEATTRWPRCDFHGCLGEAVVTHSKCFAHADPDSRDRYLTAVDAGEQRLSLRGVRVDQNLIDSILRLPGFEKNHVRISINASGAELCGHIDLDGFVFERDITLTGATIRESFRFRNCIFEGSLYARFAVFDSPQIPKFTSCHFSKDADLSFVGITHLVEFSNCKFDRTLHGNGAVGTLRLYQCMLTSGIAVMGANLRLFSLEHCVVDREIRVDGSRCDAFRSPYLRATSAHQIGPLDVQNDCTLSHAQFGARIRLEVKANRLDLSGARLIEGGHVFAERAGIDLSRLSTGRPLRISGLATSGQQPTILAMQDADAGFMSFAHVDMGRCAFYGSHDLGEVVIQPTVKLSRAPAWCTRRRVIADEYSWRRNVGGIRAMGWKLPGTRLASDPPQDDSDRNIVELPALRASQVAAVYRDLRRSFEARSDEPGAADFYYGEMEMRRHSREFGTAERAIVWMYWLFSGYGLRASRAFAWLLAVIIGGTVAAAHVGFVAGRGTYYEGLLFSLRAVLPGLQNSQQLSMAGGFIEIALTLLGPVFFALAVLALRGRVKR